MLCLVGVLLSCGVLCIASPLPRTAGAGCGATSLIQETLENIQNLISMGGSKTMPLDMMEEGNISTSLERFIEVLKSSKERPEMQINLKLQRIQDALKSCPSWMDEKWEPIEENDFFSNLEYLLRFLNHYGFPEEKV